MAKTPQITN